MLNNNTSISAGNQANINNAHKINISYNGISEQGFLSLLNEYTDSEISAKVNAAIAKIQERLIPFVTQLVSSLQQRPSLSEKLSQPEALKLILEAKNSAALTDSNLDKITLVNVVKAYLSGSNSKAENTLCSKAIEAIPFLTQEARVGLMLHSYLTTRTYNSFSTDIADDFSRCIETLSEDSLPKGEEWIRHLALLGLVELYPQGISQGIPITKILADNFDGICCAGIHESSLAHKEIMKKISEQPILKRYYIQHEFNPNYYRANVENFNSYSPNDTDEAKLISDFLTFVRRKYIISDKIQKEVTQRFINALLRHQSIKRLIQWYDTIPRYFNLTPVGEVVYKAFLQEQILQTKTLQ